MRVRRVADEALECPLEMEFGHANVLGEDRQRGRRATVPNTLVDDNLGLLDSENLAHLRR